MKYQIVGLALFASLFFLPDISNAQEVAGQMELCREFPAHDGSDFDPLVEFSKTVVASELAVRAETTWTKVVGAAKNLFVRKIGTIAGRVLVWIFEVTDPVTVALGFIFEPTTPSKCDVPYSDDPDCRRQNPCILPLSSLANAHRQQQ